MPDNFEPFFQNRRCRPGCPFFPPCRCDRDCRDRRDDRRDRRDDRWDRRDDRWDRRDDRWDRRDDRNWPWR